jgi:hypothetical protein
MSALGQDELKVLTGWSASVADNRAATLTQLIANSYPTEDDTQADFNRQIKQAKKAQFLSDVLLGNTKKSTLVEGIKKRNLKDHVRLLGRLPLDKGLRRGKDIMHRYEVLQAYKKYARGLSSLSKPETKKFKDEAAAKKEYDRLVKAKTGKGYESA